MRTYTIKFQRTFGWYWEASYSEPDEIGVTFSRGFAPTRGLAVWLAQRVVRKERRRATSEYTIVVGLPVSHPQPPQDIPSEVK